MGGYVCISGINDRTVTQRNHYYNQYKLDVVQPVDRILTLSRFEWDFECQNQYNADGSTRLTSLYVKPTALGDSCEKNDPTNDLNGDPGADADHHSGIISLGNGIAGIPNRRFNDNKMDIDIIDASLHGGSSVLTNLLNGISRNNFSTSQYSSLNVGDNHFYYTPPYYQANDNPLDTSSATTTYLQEPQGPYIRRFASTHPVPFGQNVNRKNPNQKHEAYDYNLTKLNVADVTWKTEIIFAPNCETTGNPILNVGLRTHDGRSDLLTNATLAHVLESAYYDDPSYNNVTISVQATNKTNSIYQANTIRLDIDNISWDTATPLSHQSSSGFRGEWHNYSSSSLTLDPDKIYKVTVSNLSIQQFYQIKLPFKDMVDVYDICDEPDIAAEVVCENSILFFRKLEWTENPSAQIEVQINRYRRSTPTGQRWITITSYLYTSISTGATVPVSYNARGYKQGDYSGYDPPHSDSIILNISDPDNDRYMNELQFEKLKNEVWTIIL